MKFDHESRYASTYMTVPYITFLHDFLPFPLCAEYGMVKKNQLPPPETFTILRTMIFRIAVINYINDKSTTTISGNKLSEVNKT